MKEILNNVETQAMLLEFPQNIFNTSKKANLFLNKYRKDDYIIDFWEQYRNSIYTKIHKIKIEEYQCYSSGEN